jgi:tetratricopeptide (TPR) repeat protein/DNA polymerase III delta prime subunit
MHKDVKYVAEDVKHMANEVDNISTYLLKSKRSATPLASDTVVRHQMPLKPEILHGQDDLVDGITQWLVKKETAHVCLVGPGGMGKTSVSLAVAESPLMKERFPDENCVWVPCIEATSASLLLEILYIQLRVAGDKQVTLDKIISHLNTSKQTRLLLLDNFETPWNAPGTQKQVEDILRQLAALSHIAIFITMRGTNPPCMNAIKWQWKNIQPTDDEACFRIYHDHNPNSKDDPDVGRLLAVLGYMPFAVTLMAKLGMEGMATANELLDAWQKSGPDVLSDKLEESMNRSISLSVESDLVKQNPNAIALLAILSLLPAGTTKQNLRWWAPDSAIQISMIPSAIATLSKAALLVENKRKNSDSPVLFVVPVVQSFMQQRNRIEEKIRKQLQSSCCEYVLDHACLFDDATFLDKSKALAAEDANIQSILFGSSHTIPSDRTIEAIIAFSWYRAYTKPDLEIANHALKAAKASVVKKYLVSATWCLGWTYRQLGDYHSSYNHLQEAYLLSSESSACDMELQRLHCQCGIDLVEVARVVFSEDRSKAASLAREVESKCSALSDDHLHGRCLVILASVIDDILQRQEKLEHQNRAQIMLKAVKNTPNLAISGANPDHALQRQEALEHLNRARIMLKAVKSIPNLTDACQVIARVHYREWRLPEALEAIQEAWKLVESSSDLRAKAVISWESGLIHFSANRDAEAWKHTEIALMLASQYGYQLAIARTLDLMGYGYLRRGDYENAYGAYEAAAEKYRGTRDANLEAPAKCNENMARIKMKQRNPDAEVGFHRLVWDVDKSLFYPPVQSTASHDTPLN